MTSNQIAEKNDALKTYYYEQWNKFIQLVQAV